MTWPEPDSLTADRMHRAFAQVCTELSATPIGQLDAQWGWRGRTLSRPVRFGHGRAWLRLASSKPDKISATFWNGSLDAQSAIPSSIPRPRLVAHHDLACDGFIYRAELYEHITAPVIAQGPVISSNIELPDAWWTDLRAALDTIARVPTNRRTIEQRFLDTTMPRFLGGPISTAAPSSWLTAHGDLHLANLCEPLCLLDWEGWGLAPAGYDAAILHTYTLLAPRTAARIRQAFSPLFSTRHGHFAELVAITQLLRNVEAGDIADLGPALLGRAQLLLGRSIPAASFILTATLGNPGRSVS